MQRKRKRGSWGLIILIASLFFTSAFARTPAARFLTISPSVRERAIGNSGITHADGAAAGWWNPARLVFGSSQVRLGAFRWIAESRGSWGSAKLNFRQFGLGLSYFNLTTPGFEAREWPGPPQATFNLHQAYFTLSGAARLSSGLSAGISLKGYIEDIYGDRLTGFPVWDMGVSSQIGVWQWGAVITNWGKDQQGFPLPTSFKTGVARSFAIHQFRVILASEGEWVKLLPPILHLGSEIGWDERLFLRGGWWGNQTTGHWVVGGGFNLRGWVVDFSYTPEEPTLGSGLRVGIGFIWK